MLTCIIVLQSKDAVRVLLHSVRLYPGSHSLERGLGQIFNEQKNTVKAVEYFRKAIRAEPSEASYHHSLGNAFYVSARIATAWEKAFM